MKNISEKEYPICKIWIIRSVLNDTLVFFLLIFTGSLMALPLGRLNLFLEKYSLPFLVLFIFRSVFGPPLSFFKRKSIRYFVENGYLVIQQESIVTGKKEKRMLSRYLKDITIKQDDWPDCWLGVVCLQMRYVTPDEEAKSAMFKDVNTSTFEEWLFGVQLVGYSGNKVSIPGLSPSDAEELKKAILSDV